MINRREVIASGLAVSLVAGAAAGFSGPQAKDRPSGARLFAADERFSEARTAARAAALHGARVFTVSDDITALYESLDRVLRERPVAVAGLTTKHALFVIERLAWDRGLRTAYVGIHRRGVGGRPEHEWLGAPALAERLAARSRGDWADALGRVLASEARIGERRHAVPPQSVPGLDRATLASWLLAPKSAAGNV